MNLFREIDIDTANGMVSRKNVLVEARLLDVEVTDLGVGIVGCVV
jgi:hypothetical protein